MAYSFEELLTLGRKRAGGRTAFGEGTMGLQHDITEAQDLEDADAHGRKVRRYEAGIDAKVAANQKHAEELRTKYGTTDPHVIAQMEATGALDPNFESKFKDDPVAGKAAADQLFALAGKGGAGDIKPSATELPREFRVGTGAGGEQYFTNKTNSELHSESNDRRAARGEPNRGRQGDPHGFEHMDVTPVGSISEGDTPHQSDADILFQGKLDRVKTIAEGPERDLKHMQDKERYGEELLGIGRSPDGGAHAARQRLQDDLMSGKLGKMGLKPEDAGALDALLIKRALPNIKYNSPSTDRMFHIPWNPRNKPDKAEPATVTNPDGGTPMLVSAKQQDIKADSEVSSAIDKNMVREQPRTAQYANGTAQPNPKQTPGQVPQPKPATPAAQGGKKNPVDSFMDLMTPEPAKDPQKALEEKSKDPFRIGVGAE